MRYDIMIGKGASARSIRLDLPKFTLVGSNNSCRHADGTARKTDLSADSPIGVYTVEELKRIIARSAKVLDVGIDDAELHDLRDVPGDARDLANRLLNV